MDINSDIDIHTVIKELNRLWAKKLNKREQFDEADTIIALLSSAIVNNYSFLLVHKLEYDDLHYIAGKYAEELAAIRNQKSETVRNGRYEEAARLRDREKKVIEKIITETMAGEHFKLIDETQKKILFLESEQRIDKLVPCEKRER